MPGKTPPSLEIDVGRRCTVCGNHGVAKNGLCLDCVALQLKAFQGRAVGFLTLTRAKTEICVLVDEAAKEIDEAYIKADGDLTIALGLKLVGTKMAGEIKIISSINFVESRFKRATEAVVNEKQMKLPGIK